RRPDVAAARWRAEAAAQRIHEARAAFYPDVNLAAFIGVQSLFLNKLTASGRALGGELADSRAALAASEDAYRIARLRYEGGLSTYPAVLLAEQQVLQRRRTVADLEARALTLDVQLVRALGGGYRAAA